MYYSILLPLVAGFVLDALFGDPRWLPHPVRAFGFLISKSDKWLNTGTKRILKGAIASLILIGTTWVFFFLINSVTSPFPILHALVATLIVFFGLANRSLISEALMVEKKLQHDGIDAARIQLSTIVGRNTTKLNENQVRTAVLETLSENLSDGVIAPLFYYAIGGFPLMMAYKMVNTLDSMVGYKNDRYIDFGRFAARIDDFANFIPARITAFLMIVITCNQRGFTFIFKYGRRHSSPNSGFPEAALAGILNCRLGGAGVYHGKTVEKPYIGYNCRTLSSKDIEKACLINFTTSVVAVFIIITTLLQI